MKIDSIKSYLKNPLKLYVRLGRDSFLKLIRDEKYLKLLFRANMSKKLDLDHPQTFSEKIQWLKLNDRNPLYTKLADKYEVRSHVAQKLGEEYLIPLLGGPWDSFDEIDFTALPERFVLKCTHDSGGLVICRDKSTLDIAEAGKKINGCLKRNYFWGQREWPYKGIKPRIIAEEYLTDEYGCELKDYKFMMFGGKYKCAFVCSNRFHPDGLNVTFFDPDWQRLPFERKYHADPRELPKPECYGKMVEMAQTLSKGMIFSRIDLYEANHKVYFGEITLYPGSGMELFDPPEWDKTLGDWLKLPQKS